MLSKRRLSCLLALAAIGNAQAAMAQQCITHAETTSLVIYSMPSAVEAISNSCAPDLRKDGYLARNGAAFSARYVSAQDEAWPAARKALMTLSKDQAGKAKSMGVDADALFQNLPDMVARPLVDAIILQKVAEAIQPKHCVNLEKVISAIAPLKPSEAGVLVGTLLEMMELEKPLICPTRQS